MLRSTLRHAFPGALAAALLVADPGAALSHDDGDERHERRSQYRHDRHDERHERRDDRRERRDDRHERHYYAPQIRRAPVHYHGPSCGHAGWWSPHRLSYYCAPCRHHYYEEQLFHDHLYHHHHVHPSSFFQVIFQGGFGFVFPG